MVPRSSSSFFALAVQLFNPWWELLLSARMDIAYSLRQAKVRKEAAMKAILTSKKTWLALLVVAGLAGVAWWQRRPVLAWYHVRQLTNAYQDNREACAKAVAELDEAALPYLLLGLQSPDAIVCANMQ